MLGAAGTGLSVYELPPSQVESPLEPWDLVFFPPGPTGAHEVRNNSESTARVAMFSSISEVGAVVYPDSDMIQIFTTDGEDDIVVERRSGVDVAAPWSTEHHSR